MKNKDYPERICEIIDSDSFKTKLSIISHNYSNLKQENNIRNIILEELNRIFKKNKNNNKSFCRTSKNKWVKS